MGRMWARLAVACAVVARCGADVVGIDFGSEFMKVALVQPGAPLEIVTNHISKRKSETAVSFVGGDRLFSSDASGMLSRKPDLTYSRLTTLLGRGLDHPMVEALISKTYLPTKVTMNETRGSLGVHAAPQLVKDYGGAWTEWSVEELIAMILTYAKDITRAYGGHVVRDCVITVPSHATTLERQAMLAAAELADMRVLTLIEENTAAALQFGLDRIFEEKKRVLFYNLGADSAQVSLVEYSTFNEKAAGKDKAIGQLEVLGKGWSRAAGSFSIDLALTELIADEFDKKWDPKGTKGGIRKHARPMAKIRASAKKMKEVLSANEQIPLVIPSLHDDMDFSLPMSRTKLNDVASSVFAALVDPILMALKAANCTADDVDSIEIIGGGVRVPKVQETIKDWFRANRATVDVNGTAAVDLTLGVHLNGDEAVALGAAFHGANVSTSFRVRKIGMIDYTPFAVGVSMANSQDQPAAPAEGGGLLGGFFGGGQAAAAAAKKAAAAAEGAAEDSSSEWAKKALLFASGAKIGGKPKTIAFQHDMDIVCELAYETEEDGTSLLPAGTPRVIALYNITGIAEFAAEMAAQNASGALPRPKVQLSFTLDSSGLTSLAKAEVSVVEEYEADAPPPPAPKKDKKKKTKTNETANETANDTANATEATANATEAETTTAEETPPAAEKAAANAESEEPVANSTEEAATTNGLAPGKILKKKTHKKTLLVTPSYIGLTRWTPRAADLDAARERLEIIQHAEQLRKAREAAKNELESSIYATRNGLNDREEELASVATEEQLAAVRAKCEELEEWLYDADGEKASVFDANRAELVKEYAAITDRFDEAAKRPAAVASARKALALALRNATEVWPESKPWLELEDLDDLVAKVTKAQAWFDEAEEKQTKLAAHEPPAFKVSEIASKLKPVAAVASRLSLKPKPKPPALNKTNATDNETNATNATNDAADPAADTEAWDEL